MLLVDVHAHLNHALFANDLDVVLSRAKEAGVRAVVVNGVNHATNQEVLELAKKYDIIKPALGLYPVDALGLTEPEGSGLKRDEKVDVDQTLDFIEKNKENIVAIGEVGLDYKLVQEPALLKQMKEVFQRIIELAKKLDKPLIVHSRNAEADVVEMLATSNCKKVVLHCFAGRKSVIKRAAELGFSFSVPPVVKRLQHFQTLIEMVNINQLLTETDAPWLGPIAGQRNEPANVLETIRIIAEIKKFAIEEVANNVWMNYQRLFG